MLQEYHQQNMVNPTIRPYNNQNALDKRFLSGLIQVLETNYSDPAFGVEACGQQLGLSRIHLFRKVKALTDYNPSEFINKYRLRKSKDLLRKQHSNIYGVAIEVGFSSAAYFTKKFKEEYKITPSQFISGE